MEESSAQGALWAGFTGGPVILKTVGRYLVLSLSLLLAAVRHSKHGGVYFPYICVLFSFSS